MMSRQYMDLNQLDNLKRWNTMIQKAKDLQAQNYFRTESDFNRKFINDILDRDDDRINSGIPWNPSLKQWNHLHGLVS